jgi:hypothetical protein
LFREFGDGRNQVKRGQVVSPCIDTANMGFYAPVCKDGDAALPYLALTSLSS